MSDPNTATPRPPARRDANRLFFSALALLGIAHEMPPGVRVSSVILNSPRRNQRRGDVLILVVDTFRGAEELSRVIGLPPVVNPRGTEVDGQRTLYRWSGHVKGIDVEVHNYVTPSVPSPSTSTEAQS